MHTATTRRRAADDRRRWDGHDHIIAATATTISAAPTATTSSKAAKARRDLRGRGSDVVWEAAGNESSEGRTATDRTDHGDEATQCHPLARRQGGVTVTSVTGDAGDEEISISSGPAGTAVVLDGGIGNDRILLKSGSSVAITLGAGADAIDFTGFTTPGAAVTVADFQAGAGGDNLDLDQWLATYALGDASTNPFGKGYLRLVQSGADTIVEFDRDGSGTAHSWVNLLTLQNVDLTALTAANLDNYQQPLQNGTEAGDTLYGTTGDDMLYGQGGDDTIQGFAGADQLYGGDGNDQIEAGTEADIVHGDGGDDSVDGGDGNDTLYGEAGDDVLSGGEGHDGLRGDSGNDLLDGGNGRLLARAIRPLRTSTPSPARRNRLAQRQLQRVPDPASLTITDGHRVRRLRRRFSSGADHRSIHRDECSLSRGRTPGRISAPRAPTSLGPAATTSSRLWRPDALIGTGRDTFIGGSGNDLYNHLGCRRRPGYRREMRMKSSTRSNDLSASTLSPCREAGRPDGPPSTDGLGLANTILGSTATTCSTAATGDSLNAAPARRLYSTSPATTVATPSARTRPPSSPSTRSSPASKPPGLAGRPVAAGNISATPSRRGGDDVLSGLVGIDLLWGSRQRPVNAARQRHYSRRGGRRRLNRHSATDSVLRIPTKGTTGAASAGRLHAGRQCRESDRHGRAAQNLRSNALDNVVTGGSAGDTIRLNDGGADKAFGNGGNDIFYFGAAMTSADEADGGAGTDTLILQGDYSAGLTFGASALVGIETLQLLSRTNSLQADRPHPQLSNLSPPFERRCRSFADRVRANLGPTNR